MGFDTYVWYLTSRKIPASVNSSTWLWIALFLSGARLLLFCFTGSAWLNTFIRCLVLKVSPPIIITLGTPVMWVEVHAKTSMYLFKRSRSLIFILVGSCLHIVIFCSGYLLFITILSSVSMQLRTFFSLPRSLWTVDTTIPICCIAILPSSKLCGEYDFTIMNVSVFVTVMGPSPIVTSMGISPKGYDCSPKKLTRGVFESTRRDLIDGFSFKKQCSYVTSHELPPSRYALFTCIPYMYTLIMRGSDEPTFERGGNANSILLFVLRPFSSKLCGDLMSLHSEGVGM
ncbi:hypothetical protein Tco_0837219 [Tanacetum coccineum]